MFTGLVQDIGVVRAATQAEGGVRLGVDTGLASELRSGDSVAVCGACLTVAGVSGAGFAADVMGETLDRSTLGSLAQGDLVNLELPLRASDRLGGHFVQGHVDGTGTVAGVEQDGFARRVTIDASASLCDYVVEKGSVALDGVSLTATEAGDESFAAALIPETLERTTLGRLVPGQPVNVEVDILAKYVGRLAAARPVGEPA